MAETLPAVAPDLAELGGPRDCMLDGPCRQGPRTAGARGRSVAQRRPRASIAAANSPTAGLRRLKPSTSHSSACW